MFVGLALRHHQAVERHRGVTQQLAVDRVAELLVAAPASSTDITDGDRSAESLEHDVLAACRTSPTGEMDGDLHVRLDQRGLAHLLLRRPP